HDIQGNTLIQNRYPSFNTNQTISLNCENWKTGIYFVSIISENENTVHKIVIE
ncbi:MAG: T9SS type A sorting domain-containing protein, partial [Bacteroidales bacterium]|nr:T9SS type A sorting domain-containing protein [Bacteroidales bacterium]